MRNLITSAHLPGGVDTRRRRVEWERLPQHPVIATQPEGGQDVTFMHADENTGVMYLGYGDWGDNTGPISVVGYDLETGFPVTLLADCPTEAFNRCRDIDGTLYLPATDPRGPHVGGYATNEGGTWHWEAIGPMVHTFDMAEWEGDLYACGSILDGATGRAVVYRRTGGAWSAVLTSTEVHDFARFYTFAMDNEGRLTTMTPLPDSSQSQVYRTANGTTWTADPATIPWLPEFSDSTDPGEFTNWADPSEYPPHSYAVSVRSMLGGYGGGHLWAYHYPTKRVWRRPWTPPF